VPEATSAQQVRSEPRENPSMTACTVTSADNAIVNDMSQDIR